MNYVEETSHLTRPTAKRWPSITFLFIPAFQAVQLHSSSGNYSHEAARRRYISLYSYTRSSSLTVFFLSFLRTQCRHPAKSDETTRNEKKKKTKSDHLRQRDLVLSLHIDIFGLDLLHDHPIAGIILTQNTRSKI